MKLLENKRAIVTGGSQGIGFGIAKAFVQGGADILLIARDNKKLDRAVTELSGYGPEVKFLSADLSEVDGISDIAEKIMKDWRKIDILVNNVGTARFTPFSDVDAEELRWLIDLNVVAPYRLTQQLLPALKGNGSNIINISSFFSHRMIPGRPSTAYSLTKGAIDSFTLSLAAELGPHGIRVNAIAPGTVNTPLVREGMERLPEEIRTKAMEMFQTIYPLRRIGEPDDLGGIAVLLASDQASWITGSIVAVDGGLTTN